MRFAHNFLITALLLGSAFPITATEWYRLTPNRAIEIISRADAEEETFGKKRIDPRVDDRVIIDFLDFHDAKQALSEIVTTPDGFSAQWNYKGLTGKAESRVEQLTPGKIRYRWRLVSAEPQKVKESFFAIRLNRSITGRNVTFFLPKQTAEVMLAAEKDGHLWHSPWNSQVTAVEIPLNHGTLRLSGFMFHGGIGASVFKYGEHQGNIRIHTQSGMIGEIAGMLDIEWIPHRSTPLDLRTAANMGFQDDVSGDRKGGWTDQGPDNDLRAMTPGNKQFSGIGFHVADPAENDGKSVLVFSDPAHPYFQREAKMPAGTQPFDCFCLLHAAAWAEDAGESSGRRRRAARAKHGRIPNFQAQQFPRRRS